MNIVAMIGKVVAVDTDLDTFDLEVGRESGMASLDTFTVVSMHGPRMPMVGDRVMIEGRVRNIAGEAQIVAKVVEKLGRF